MSDRLGLVGGVLLLSGVLAIGAGTLVGTRRAAD
jgi:hypothetical protein